jgi:ferric-dicitrate binding protein FerR (iron transport regulator)
MITNPNELDRAIENAFDGTASEEELHALRETLRSDPAARDRYYEQAGLHQALSQRFSHGSGSETARLLANARLRAQMRRSGRLALFAAAAVFVLAAILLQTILVPKPEPLVLFETARGSKFTVQHARPDAKLGAGELAGDSQVTLSQGSLELRFRGGSRAVVLGPATFSLHSERKLHLTHGAAWFYISEEDRGFEVSTPELHITDLGTEFGVITDPAAPDEVHVFKGRLITRSLLNPFQHEETLDAGQSRGVDPVGGLTPLASRSEAFLVRLPETTSDRLIANGNFESGAAPAGVRYGRSATQAMLAGWRFGREIGILKPSAEGRWASRGSVNNHFPLHFGISPGDGSLSHHLNGYLDDVAIWSGALSQSEIEALWNGGAGRAAASISVPGALMSNWTFDADLADRIGAKDATAFGDAGIQTATSKIGAGAAVFHGRGGMTAGSRKDFAVGTGALSVSFWFKVNDADKGISKRLLATGAGVENQEGWCFFMDDSAARDRIGAAMSDGIGRSVQKGNANRMVDPFDGNWHLAVAVFDAATATVSTYLDSILEATITPDLLNGGAIGVNVLTIFSSTADRQVGFHAAARGRPDPEGSSIYQSFLTEPGREYEVEFEMGGIFFHNAQVEVTASVHDGVGPGGNPLAQHVERRSRQSGNGYNPPARFRFVAASSATTLVFTETSNDSENADPVLDNVTVRAVDGV